MPPTWKKGWLPYLFCALFILSWWLLAFWDSAFFTSSSNPTISFESPTEEATLPDFLHNFSSIKREQLLDGLSGNFSLMLSLITEWDIEAQILKKEKIPGIKQLSQEQYLKAHTIGKLLLNQTTEELKQIHAFPPPKWVIDDGGRAFQTEQNVSLFFPQTYVSAAFLLALVPPEQIVAIPKGLRKQTQLFPQVLLDKIPLDIDHFTGEKLYLKKPDIAFVSHYSHPTTLQTLKQQNIPLFTISRIDTFEEIMDALLRLGYVTNHHLQAKLLKTFAEAAMIAIDNRLAILTTTFPELPPSSIRLLYLDTYTKHSTPTEKALPSKLMDRLGINHLGKNYQKERQKTQWKIPLEQEQIVNMNPDCVILSTSQGESEKKQFMHTPAFAHLSAVQKNHIFIVDETIQESPSQYIVLAYYDLFHALTKATIALHSQ